MPTANAPTLGRNRSSVRIATAKPPSTSPSTSSRSTRTPSNVSRPIACGTTMSSASPDSPALSPATANPVTPLARLSGVVRAKTE